jgi:hypothetical protein
VSLSGSIHRTHTETAARGIIGGEDTAAADADEKDIAILDLVRVLSSVLAVDEKAAWLNDANMFRKRSSSRVERCKEQMLTADSTMVRA